MSVTQVAQSLRKLPLWKILLGAWLIVTTIGQATSLFQRFRAAPPGPHVLVNDSTQAQQAAIRRETEQLKAVVDAAKTLQGQLVAGFQITVKGDTIYQAPVKTVTTVLPDSSRHATLTDTTKGYTIEVNAVAPPFPDKLQLGYKITTPAFKPQVGFVKRGDGYYAVASWAGQTFTTEHAFFSPEKPRTIGAVVGAELRGSPAANVAGFSLAGSGPFAALEYRRDANVYQLRLGDDGRPYIGVQFTHKLF